MKTAKKKSDKIEGLQGAELEEYERQKSLTGRRYRGRAAHLEGHSYVLPIGTPTETRKRVARERSGT